MEAILSVVVVVVVLGILGLVWWGLLSQRVIGPKEVGVKVRFGKPKSVHNSGRIFAPWYPFKWDGHRVWDIIRIPTDMFQITYEGSEDHRIWSSDHQLLVVEVAVYVRFPYADPAALVKMVKAGVPTTLEALKKWMEEEVLRVVRAVMAKRTYKVAISGAESEEIAAEANALFSRPNGLLVRSGVYGTDVEDTSEGKGEVFLKIEQVLLTGELQRKLQSVEEAKLGAEAAKQTGIQGAKEVGLQVMITVALASGVDVDDEAALAAFMKKINDDPTLRTRPASKGGYAEEFKRAWNQVNRDRAGAQEIRIGSPDGTPLPKGLQYFSMGGAGAGVMVGGKGGGRGKRRKASEMGADEVRQAVDEDEQ